MPAELDLTLDHLLHRWERAGLPCVEALENDLGPGFPAFDHVRAAAGVVLADPVERPGIGRRRVLLGELGIDDHRDRHGKIGELQFVRLGKGDLERQGIDHHKLIGRLHVACAHLDAGKSAN